MDGDATNSFSLLYSVATRNPNRVIALIAAKNNKVLASNNVIVAQGPCYFSSQEQQTLRLPHEQCTVVFSLRRSKLQFTIIAVILSLSVHFFVRSTIVVASMRKPGLFILFWIEIPTIRQRLLEKRGRQWNALARQR